MMRSLMMTRRGVLRGFAALLLLPGCKSADAGRLDYGQLFALGDGFLIVAHTPQKLTGHQSLGRVALMGTDGVMRHKIEERTKLALLGITDEVVWITRSKTLGRLSAYTRDSLSPIAGVDAALKAHPVLSKVQFVKGMHGDDAVMEGGNAKLYSVNAKGTIEKLPSDTKVEEPPRVDTNGQIRLPLEQLPKNDPAAKKLTDELDHASKFRGSAGLLGGETQDMLILHQAYTQDGTAPQLSRAAPDGTLEWTTALSDLTGPVEIKDPDIELVAALRAHDETWLLVRTSKMERWQQKDYYEVEHHLVSLDPSTGKAIASHEVREGK